MFKEFFFKHSKEKVSNEEVELSPKTQTEIDMEVNRRVAVALSKIDPFETLMKEFHGIFSEEHERVEDVLDTKGALMLKTWAYQTRDNPSFKWITEWVMNTQANETLKRAVVTPDRILYGRAQVSCMLVFVKEIKRLASLYEDQLAAGRKDEDFDESASVE